MHGFLVWWQHIPEHLNPVLIQIGPLRIHYYGLGYVIAFLVTYLLIKYRLKTEKTDYSWELINKYFIWAIFFGVLLGGRIGYVLFYNLKYYIAHPLEIILPFSVDGGLHYTGIYGMSYHGGLLSLILVTFFFCKLHKIRFLDFADFLIPCIPLGYTFGRIGNFINSELYGRVTDFALGMYFPTDKTGLLRHPSQLYEAFFEGIVLFIILWSVRKKKAFSGFVFFLYLIGYGLLRFLVEFVRDPDAHLGFIVGPFTMGQVLCFFMALSGVIMVFALKKKAWN